MLSAAESELNHLRKYTTIWYVAWLRGEVDVDALTTAAAVLRQTHPYLSARVESVGRRFRIVTESVGGTVVAPQTRPLESLATLPVLSLGDGTFAILVFPREGGSVVAVGVDHSIADARLSYSYFHELWDSYTRIVTAGETPQAHPQPPPEAPETAMARRGLHRTAPPEKPWFGQTVWGGTQRETAASATTALGWKHRFGAEQSAQLRAAARRRGSTVNGLVTGVIALAERALLPVAAHEPVNLGFESLVDYRRHLVPPAELGEIANGIMIARSQVLVRARDDPQQIGAEVTRQIIEDIDSGLLVQGVHHIADTLLTGRFGPFIRITNPGVLPAPALPAGLSMDDFDIHLSAERTSRTAGADDAPLPQASRYEVYSICDRLTIVGKFPAGSLTREQADALRADVVAGIHALATPGSS
ncbi:acyltransferase [Mycobacterium sp. CBMA271]|nr:acyltransferase [Mycobacteroides sp. CBMA 326]MUM23957.1 acyltransferase [Mycobacteroides sp. CBMA 271]